MNISLIVIFILIIINIIEGIVISWILKNIKCEKKIKKTIEFFRQLWGKFTFYVLATSVIGLFLGSIYFEKEIELNTINNWVSIVLGLVALIIGIISLFLSFFNLDETNKSNTRSVEIMQELQNKLTDLMNDMRQDIKSKIDESNEKTRSYFNSYNETNTNNSYVQQQGINTWEDVKNGKI